MGLTLLLSLSGCALLFFSFLGLTVTLPANMLTKTRFFQHCFPETEGCAGWRDFGYNRKRQAGQCVMILIGSILTAGVFALIQS